MSTIRRQSIISSVLIYIGFIFGAINTYLFTKEGIFTPEEYGLTRAIIITANFFFGFASFGVIGVIYKFFPYYSGNLKDEENDLLGVCLLLGITGFALTTLAGFVFEPLVTRKFSAKSALFIRYYYWVFPFLFFYLFFSILEAYAWSLKKTVLSNFLKESGFRISTTLLILLFVVGAINFELFIKLFSLLYAVSFFVLLFYLVSIKKFHITLRQSRVTRKFWKKIATLAAFVFGGSAITIGAQTADSFSIMSFVPNGQGLAMLAVFDFSQYICSVISVPQRSVVSISVAYLSEAWRNKDFDSIQRIYSKSSLNLLMISLFIFLLIWLNYDRTIIALNLTDIYLAGKWVVFVLGIKFIIDMGTGVNQQIIGTSTFWRFEFFCGIILLVLAIPLNIILVKRIGIVGAAYSNLIAFSVYNFIRLYFLWAKFKLFPFSKRTLLAILHAVTCYFICYFLFGMLKGWPGIILSSIGFTALFVISAYYFKLSPEIEPVWNTVKKRLGRLRR
jgi:O-antigen/teichoic acid export membrane protein